MKQHRTPLLANAVTGSVRTPARGPVVPAAAYTAHTRSSEGSEESSDPRLTNSRQSTALRERLSQTRARIARAHADRPPQIDLEWDAEEPLTRVYQGERFQLPHASYERAPSYSDLSAQLAMPEPHAHDGPAQPMTAEPSTPTTPPAHALLADHANDAWYSDLQSHATEGHLQLPTGAGARAKHANATSTDRARTHATPVDHSRKYASPGAQAQHAQPRSAPQAQHAHATPADFPREHAHAGSADHPHEPAHAQHARVARPARAPRVDHGRAHSEQARTARIDPPVATPAPWHDLSARTALSESAPPLSAAHLWTELSTQRERLTLAATSAANTVRDHLGKLYANVDRSDAALRKRVAYCSVALLAAAAVSRMVFGGEAGASESSQAGATHQPAPAPQQASVSISSDPPGALIYLDGETKNLQTPSKLSDLAPGRHTISLKLAGYAETKEALNLPADALVSIKLASLSEPRFAPEPIQQRPTAVSRAEQRAQARELARERRAAARAAKVLLRYRARMGLPPDPVAQELVDAYGPTASAE